MVKKKKPRGKPLGPRKSGIGVPIRLVAIRLLKGWSQSEAASQIGITPGVLRALESGKKFGIVEELLVRIADVYGTSLDHIYGRAESAIQRFAASTPEVQSAQLNGVMSGLARLAQSSEALQYIDELVKMAADELPEWPSLQLFLNAPATERSALLHEIALTVSRLARDRTAVNYLGALILQFAKSGDATPKYAYSMERDQTALSHSLTAIERAFGKSEQAAAGLTPSRYRVVDASPTSAGKKAKSNTNKTARKPARKSVKKLAKKK
jgi:transcriptional regulator with XRE-family HTH domain